MTVSSELNRKTFSGDGVTTSFGTFPVVFFDTSDLMVFVVDSSGTVTTLVENTGYTVTGGAGSTGTVDLASGDSPHGVVASGSTLVIVRSLPIVQETDFVQNDSSDAEVAEDALDKVVMIAQQLNARIDRSFVLADSDVSGADLTVPTPSADKLIGWNAAGDALENKTPADLDLAVVTAFVATLIDDANADTFVQTLVSGLSAETAPAVDDVVLIGDTSEGKGNKMTLANTLKVIDALTADTAPDVADEVVTYDASASAAKKVTLSNALKVVNGLTADATPDTTADYVLTYDASASGPKKVLLKDAGAKTLGTEAASTSGTAVSFTSLIPAGVKRITVMFVGVSLSGTAHYLIQMGPSGTPETSAYVSSATSCDSATPTTAQSTSGFVVFGGASGAVIYGSVTFNLEDSSDNTWVAQGVQARSDAARCNFNGGGKSFAGAIDSLKVTTTNGTDTFDAGVINISWER